MDAGPREVARPPRSRGGRIHVPMGFRSRSTGHLVLRGREGCPLDRQPAARRGTLFRLRDNCGCVDRLSLPFETGIAISRN